jgi:hypothetical protein
VILAAFLLDERRGQLGADVCWEGKEGEDLGPVWEGSGSGSTSGFRRSPPKRQILQRLRVWSWPWSTSRLPKGRRSHDFVAPPGSALLFPLLPLGGARGCRSGLQQEGGGSGDAEAEGKREERGREEGGGNTWDLPLLRRFAPPSIDLRRRSHRSRAGVHRFAPPEPEPAGGGAGRPGE